MIDKMMINEWKEIKPLNADSALNILRDVMQGAENIKIQQTALTLNNGTSKRVGGEFTIQLTFNKTIEGD